MTVLRYRTLSTHRPQPGTSKDRVSVKPLALQPPRVLVYRSAEGPCPLIRNGWPCNALNLPRNSLAALASSDKPPSPLPHALLHRTLAAWSCASCCIRRAWLAHPTPHPAVAPTCAQHAQTVLTLSHTGSDIATGVIRGRSPACSQSPPPSRAHGPTGPCVVGRRKGQHIGYKGQHTNIVPPHHTTAWKQSQRPTRNPCSRNPAAVLGCHAQSPAALPVPPRSTLAPQPRHLATRPCSRPMLTLSKTP